MTDDLTPESRHDGLSRRSVVKTGANLAWAVPAVSIATAAPALAVSPPPEESVEPPPAEEQNQQARTNNAGNKATAFVPMGTAQEDLVPGDIIVVVKTKGKATGGGRGYAKNPAAGRRDEFTFVLNQAVASGEELPDFKVNIKPFRKNGKKRLPKRSRYFVTDSTTGELIFSGVISV